MDIIPVTDAAQPAKPAADPVKRVHELWAKVRNAKLAARPMTPVDGAKMRAANDFN
jgi:hypothetical protein